MTGRDVAFMMLGSFIGGTFGPIIANLVFGT